MKISTREENPQGFHQRYKVTKLNGDPIDESSEYFVLRLDENGDDMNHIAACRKAILTYAKAIADHLPNLSYHLIHRYGDNTIKRKLRPCDCKDAHDASMLETQGIKHNDEGISVMPNYVELTMGHTTIKIGMKRFKMFAEWYLEEQEIKNK